MKRRIIIQIGLVFVGLALIVGGIIGCGSMGPGTYAPSARIAPAASEAGHERPNAVDLGGARPDELWIIQRPGQQAQRTHDDTIPGTGSLVATVPGETTPVPVPLRHTDVKASIAGYIGTVDVTQQYHNPFSTKIEAVYVFPLPHNAAVNEFVMTIGERRIRGIIRERQEAERIYKEARSQGYVASLLTQERPNVFTQSVANIEPGKQIDVNIRYYHTLSYVDGWYEFVFPMVVGPRFNPPGFNEGVGAVERGGHGTSGQKTEVQYLRPDERSGHDIALSVNIDAGTRVENVQCRSHSIEVKQLEGGHASVNLAASDRIPNKDFVLRYQVAGREIRPALIAHRDERGGYFTLMLVPPASLQDTPRQPLELVFTLDTSGSMDGRPIEQSRAAMRYALRHMDDRDTFQVIRFGDRAEKLFSEPQPANDSNVGRAMSWIDRTKAGGGTMMVDGMRASLRFAHDESRLRFVAFLTDGYIGNESQVLAELRQNLGPARIFSFGVGSSTNRYLMESMARMGNGAAAFLGLNDPADEVMAAFFDRISRAAMTDIEIDWGGMDVHEVYPRRIPDLFVGRPVIITGRFHGGSPGDIRIRGRVGGRVHEIPVAVKLDNAGPAGKALPVVWARTKIADLADESITDSSIELPQRVRQIALEYGLMSPYTAFIAVDSSVRTAGDHGITVPVPVPVPDGVRYDTTVQPKNAAGRE